MVSFEKQLLELQPMLCFLFTHVAAERLVFWASGAAWCAVCAHTHVQYYPLPPG